MGLGLVGREGEIEECMQESKERNEEAITGRIL